MASEIHRIYWTNRDWEALALELAKNKPERMTAQTLHFAPLEIMTAMKKVIPTERQRPATECKAGKMTKPLLQTYRRLRLREPSGNTPIEGTITLRASIYWSPDEWKCVAIEMERQNPGIFANRLEDMRTHHIREAQQVLPLHRHKNPNQLGVPRAGFLKAWDAMTAEEKERSLVRNMPIADTTVTPSPIHQAEQVHSESSHQSEDDERKQRVQWTTEEWVQVAAEIHRLNPHPNYLESKTLAGLDKGDLVPAIKVLPLNRRREVVNGVGPFRKNLLEAFSILRSRVAEEKLLDILTDPDPKQPEQWQAENVMAQDAAPAEVNRFEAAFAPMIKLFAEEFGKAFLPLAAEMIRDLVKGEPSDQLPEVPKKEIEKFHAAVGAMVNAVQPRQRLPKIAVVGPKATLQQELKQTFKNIDFTFIDASNHPSRDTYSMIQNCDRIIGATSFISHSTESVLKRTGGEKYCPVHGGLSSIKRQIGIWISSGAIQSAARLQ